jgi:peptidylprolyl isomerase
MRVRALVLALPLAVGVLLAGCGSAGTSTPTNSSPTAAPATLGPSVPPATAVAAAVPADQMPTATGGFGEKPTLTFPSTDPPPSLQRVILSEGTGPVTQSGDWLITNYLGQVWGGDVFDNSYDRGSTSAFQIGVRKVVPGWDVGLVGVPVGSRVLLSLPPADGYGSAGKSDAKIGGTDTLVFVVDIVDAIGPDAAGQSDAEVQPAPANAPQVSGDLGGPATVTVPAGTPEPTTPTVTVLAKGTGTPIELGQVLVQYSAVTWTGEDAGSTWTTASAQGGGPQELPVSTGGPFEGLVGVPLGSRVLVQVPGQSDPSTGQSQPAIAAVVDVLYQTTVTPATTPSGSAPASWSPSSGSPRSAGPTS